MSGIEKVVVRYLDGSLLKGEVSDFQVHAEELVIREAGTHQDRRIPLGELKAVFFVRSLEGDAHHKELKRFGARADADRLGKKIFIKFQDGESIYGFFKGDLPWKQGFFVSEGPSPAQGFFITPTDGASNNIRIFVVGSAIKDITAIAP